MQDVKIMLIGLFAIMASCGQPTFKDRDALLEYLNHSDNGYVQRKTINNIMFDALYKPTDVFIKADYQHSIDSLQEKYDQHLYFELSMHKDGKEILAAVPGNRAEHSVLSQKLAFHMADHIQLTTPTDTLELLDYVFSRTYGMAGSNSLLLVFEKKETIKKEHILKLHVSDFGLRTGDMTFYFDTKKIVNPPIIQF